MQEGNGTIKVLLRCGIAGGREVHRAESFARRGMLMLLSDAAYCQDQKAGAEDLDAEESQGMALLPKGLGRVEEIVMMLALPQEIVSNR